MKRTHFSQLISLVLGMTAVALLTACGSQSVKTDPVQSSLVLSRASVADAAVAFSVQPPLEAAKGRTNFKSFHYQAGTLLQGSDESIYYLTEAGTRRQIHNEATFAAFGFNQASVVKVDDSLLGMLPIAEEVTPLVWAGDANLYWIFNGQRWLVNEWKTVVTRPDYSGIPVTHLDSHLEQTLPVRLGFESGMLLHEQDVVYYFNAGSIIPTPVEAAAAPASVVDVPPGVLAAYRIETHLSDTYLSLNDGGSAEVRQGPGLEHTLLGAIARKVLASGRSQDGQWLRVTYLDQPGWLAAEQIADPVAVSLLPTVPDTSETGLPQAQPVAFSR